MAIYEFEGNRPEISDLSYIHPSASVIGNVLIGDQCFIGPGAVIRADYGKVCLGAGCAVEDNCIIHSEPSSIVIMENDIIIGHGAIVHGPCLIKNNAIIGMGSIVSTGCEIGSYAFLAAGTILLPGQHIPERTLAAGNPATLKKPVDEKLLYYSQKAPDLYRDLCWRCRKGLKLITP
jgi:carbonic anhydrase/acetyltransferase-like protein (isoleucine patch superfamily)